MASKDRKKSEKKSGKKCDENVNENKQESPVTDSMGTPSEENLAVEVVEPPPVPTPEPTYDEPALSELIVERFEGEKVKGLYDGEGEADFTGGHHYKGMFSEGCMHGRGKYTWCDGISFEGDFVKNQVTGKGTYTWKDGSTYVGDVLYGKRHGLGTFRSACGAVSYSGDWCMGQRHGKGRMDFDVEGKSYYDGDWVNGIKHGWGTRQYPSGNVYHGMWFNNVRHGEGTMKWLDRDQVYAGQWENGIQHGMGQHIWLLRRVHRSQYPLRNMYDGELVNGLRHGQGVFYYANGAKYEGMWKDNMKHGQGKFTFKNGRIYEGLFEKDHIVEYPDFTMDGTTTPDLTQIRTRTPLATDNISVHSNESKNTTSPSFQLEINTLLSSLPSDDVEHEVNQVLYSITRHITALRRIYTFYSTLGYEESPDNTFIMNKLQFWRFLKDIRLHHDRYSLTEMDRVIGQNYQKSNFELHNPYEKILQRQFVNYLVILAHLLYKEDHQKFGKNTPLLEYCFSRLMTEKVLRYSCAVKSPIYVETRRATNALVHMDQAYEIYQGISSIRKRAPREPTLKMRDFLFLLKDLHLINQDLTAASVIGVMASDNPSVADGQGSYNLELEMTFLEFFEALVGCAEIFVTESVVRDPSTPRPSTVLTHDQSMYSVPASPSRMTSQGNIEEADGSVRQATPYHPSAGGSPTGRGTPERNPSSIAMTNKTGGDESNRDLTGGPSEVAVAGKSSQHGSARQDVLGGEMHKSASFVSARTNPNSDENQPLMQSSVSLIGPDGQPIDTEEADPFKTESKDLKEDESILALEAEMNRDQGEEEEHIDEATRKYNFWTHQVHIFFVRKFFPGAEKHIKTRKAAEARRVQEARVRAAQISAQKEEEAAARAAAEAAAAAEAEDAESTVVADGEPEDGRDGAEEGAAEKGAGGAATAGASGEKKEEGGEWATQGRSRASDAGALANASGLLSQDSHRSTMKGSAFAAPTSLYQTGSNQGGTNSSSTITGRPDSRASQKSGRPSMMPNSSDRTSRSIREESNDAGNERRSITARDQ